MYEKSIRKQVFNERKGTVTSSGTGYALPMSNIKQVSKKAFLQKKIRHDEPKDKNYRTLMVSLQGVIHLLLSNMCGLSDQSDEPAEFV